MDWRRHAGLLGGLRGPGSIQRALQRLVARPVRANGGFGDLDCGCPDGESPAFPQTLLARRLQRAAGALLPPWPDPSADPGVRQLPRPRRDVIGAVDCGASSPGPRDVPLRTVVRGARRRRCPWADNARRLAETACKRQSRNLNERFRPSEGVSWLSVGLGVTRRAATSRCGCFTPTRAGQSKPS